MRKLSKRLRGLTALIGVVGVVAATVVVGASSVFAASPCTGNAIVCENQLPGTPQDQWQVNGGGDPSIQGFATQISVNVGQQVSFKIKTTASAYTVKIFRLGYYQGDGARYIADATVTANLPQQQPACATDPATEIYDCGTWGVSASWSVPTTAVSGVYIARLYRADLNDASLIPFIVRNDASTSDIVFQTSDPTWEAYNTYGQSDFYQGLANGRAYKVSYNRPITTGGDNSGRDFLFSNEYPTIKFLEQNGYDVSYISGLDTDIHGNLLTNHKVFLSVGHDEYWSDGQRTNVEKARDAGVNLAFLSGNEVYWKTRWEASEDGSNTPNRTLVCYKDTWANQQIDPLGPTSTWRDPRWGGNGKGPENGLTGTLYMSNFTDLPITVSAAEGKNRLWRNTSLASLAPGTSKALSPHTVGYESDEDLDNGFRPAGLIRLSTTTGAVPQYLQDYGNTVVPGVTTHHITLYRAASGALVFSAGTVQWGWGLDADHDGTQQPADPQMRQATMNLLADMGASASTPAPDLVPATKSTDTVAPTATVTSPASGASITAGSLVTVTGSATDAGGGVVAGVEVSTDGGHTWHPATGTTSFTYTGVLSGSGTGAIQARAIDDSANIQSPATMVNVQSSCPCSIFGAVVPALPDAGDGSAVSLGVKFTSSTGGFVSAIRFYKSAANTGTHVGYLYRGDGTLLSSVTFTGETASGWQTANLPSAVPITAGTTYVVAYDAPNGHYSADLRYFGEIGHTGGVLTASGGAADQGNGVYGDPGRFPQSSYQSSNYYVDVVWSQIDQTPLAAGSPSPLPGSSSVLPSVTPSAVLSRSIVTSSLAMTVVDPTNQPVPGSVSYDSTTRQATFTPSSVLKPGTTYTVQLNASSPDVGPMAAPLMWSFTTAAAPELPGVCPCTLFDETDQPTQGPDRDSAVQLGMAFSSDTDGTVTGIKFFKDPTDTATTHSVTLWSPSGSALGTANTSTESTAGWQTATFATPISVSKGQSYIASYLNTTGRYSFTAGGLSNAIDRSPLHTPVGAGRYNYGTTALTSTSATNYFVDAVFVPAPEAPPTVAAVDPADTATSVPVTAPVTVTFSAPIKANSASVVLTDSAGSIVPGAIAGESSGSTITFVPTSPLAAGTHYTVSVSGAQGLGGTAMAAPFVSSFTTSSPAACPCTLLPSTAVPQLSDSGDASAVSVGVRLTSSVSGYVTGIRYYADANNVGAHTGSLWGPDGTRLATVAFDNSTVAGWRYATFSPAVPVSAGTNYIASVYMPYGHYSATSAFYGGPYVNTPLTGDAGLYTYGSDTLPTSSYNNANYYVDVVFNTQQPQPAPQVTAASPAQGGTTAATSSALTATFSADVDPTSISFGLAAAGGATVTGQTTYDAGSHTATFTPAAPLSYSAQYNARVSATAVQGGVAMAAPYAWSFTTVAAPVPTVTSNSPASGATAVPTASVVTAAFSVPIDQSTLSFTLTTSGGATVAKTVTYDPVAQVATLKPNSALSTLTSYQATVSAKSVNGVAMSAPVKWSFTTGGPAPTISSRTPGSGQNGVAITTTVAATFNKAIDPSTLSLALTDPSGTVVPGTLTYNATSRQAVLDPTALLSYSTKYTATVRANATDGGFMTAPSTWTFTTVAVGPAPTVSSVSPGSNSTRVSPTTKVSATFSRSIDPTTLRFAVSTSSGAQIAGSVVYTDSNRQAVFTPTASLPVRTTLTASVQATASVAGGGGSMANPVKWSFTTAAF